ncbi:MAG TPA: LPS assembly lipoprotein LptE [Bryobacteraceae bacterium]|nr:LPS assembly lipoprotein LptE [Bryobacteraceae bacterium]
MRPRLGLALALGVSLMLAGCGYHVSGKDNKLPTDLRTLAIPAFTNGSQVYRVEQDLTSAVVREFITRTHYQIVNRQDRSADATLQGTVLAASVFPLTFDTRTNRVATVLVQVGVHVTLTDKKGKVLYDNPSYLFREQYQESSSLATFFQEESPALERLSRDFARSLVSDVLENY